MEGATLIFGLATVFLVLQIVTSIWAARQLPPGGPVPVHFDMRGRPDRFGSRWITLGIMPASYVFLNVLTMAIGQIADEPVEMAELVTAQLVLGALLLATHGFIVFLLLRWARNQ